MLSYRFAISIKLVLSLVQLSDILVATASKGVFFPRPSEFLDLGRDVLDNCRKL